MLRITPKTPEEVREREGGLVDEEVMTVRYYNENYYIAEYEPSRENPDPPEPTPEQEPTYNYWYCSDCGVLYEPEDLILVKYGPLLPPEEGAEEAPPRTTEVYCVSSGTEIVRVEDPETGVPRQEIREVVCDQPLVTNSPSYWVENFNIVEKITS
jgi:hypothetical protein